MKNTAHFKFWLKRVPYELEYPKVPLFEFLETSARRYPHNTAIIYYGARISYGYLLDEVERTATLLFNMDVKKGDRVALYMQNTPHFIVSFFGILRANAVVVPINPMLTEKEVLQILSDSGAVAAITTSDIGRRLLAVKDESSIVNIIVGSYTDYLPDTLELQLPESIQKKYNIEDDHVWQWSQAIQNISAAPPPLRVSHTDMAILPYTSGSTGLPKGCVHTHATVISNTVGSVVWHNMLPNNTILATLPLFHVTGLVHSFLAPICAGSSMVLMTRWNRDTAIAAIEKYRCTHWTNITTMVIDILNYPDIRNRDLSSLMIIGGGGAPLPEAVGRKLFDLTGLQYIEGYGMTETISQTHFNPPDRPKLQCIGIPHFGVDARIINIDSGKEVGPNEQGELIVSGPELMEEYWNRPEENQKIFKFIDGIKFLCTGDICTIDEEGYFYIVDRIKRMINAAGYKVWPSEVEAVLYEHPAVSEVCVVAVPDPIRVENVKAYIVLTPEAKGKTIEADIIDWAKQNMAAYRYPRIVEFVKELPKSGTGKILWRYLQDMEKQKSHEKSL